MQSREDTSVWEEGMGINLDEQVNKQELEAYRKEG